jgi:hypothetical protein
LFVLIVNCVPRLIPPFAAVSADGTKKKTSKQTNQEKEREKELKVSQNMFAMEQFNVTVHATNIFFFQRLFFHAAALRDRVPQFSLSALKV